MIPNDARIIQMKNARANLMIWLEDMVALDRWADVASDDEERAPFKNAFLAAREEAKKAAIAYVQAIKS